MDSEQMRESARAILKHIGMANLDKLVIDTDRELGLVGEPGQAGIQTEGYWIEQYEGKFTLFPMTSWTEYGQQFSEPDTDDPLMESDELDPLVFEMARRTLNDWMENAELVWFEDKLADEALGGDY